MDNNGYTDNTNPFGKREYDFYDEIITSDARRDFSKFFFALFLFNVISYIAVFALSLGLTLYLGTERMTVLASNPYFSVLAGTLPMYTVALPVLFFFVKKMPERHPVRQDFGIKTFFALIPVTFLFIQFGNVLGIYLNAIIGALRGRPVVNATEELLETTPLWLTFIFVVIAAPIVEEFIFRRLMISKLSRYGYVTAIVVSSIAFGLFHGNLYQFFYAMLVGLILGYIYVKSGNWLYSVLMHAIVNFYGGIVSSKVAEIADKYFTLYDAKIAGEMIDEVLFARYEMITYLFSMLTFALVLGGSIILSVALRRRSVVIADHDGRRIPKGRRFNAVIINVGGILFVLSSLLIFIISII